MERRDIIDMASRYVESAEGNRIGRETALSEKVVGMRIYETPIFAFGAANDQYFQRLKDPAAIGAHFLLPQEWLPQAKTVISFFLPFSEAVIKGNSLDMSWPADEWLHARIEGQAFLVKLCQYLQSELIKAGHNSLVPILDARFWSKTGPKPSQYATGNSSDNETFTSNWSERHVAYVCGLGTFGLSKGLITPKGIAGRFGSIITELDLPPDQREYEDIYEYCTKCGVCVKNCPVQAISLAKGKEHQKCSDFLDLTAEKNKPRYGCGKCQVQVPCQSRIPAR